MSCYRNCNCSGKCCCPGPRGDTGPQGPAGPVGPVGPKGNTGATGLNYTSTNFAILVTTSQLVPNNRNILLSGPFFANNVSFNGGDTITILQPGFYSFQFVVTTAANQPGPLEFGIFKNNSGFATAGGGANSTSLGQEVTGIGFAYAQAGDTFVLKNISGQDVTLRGTVTSGQVARLTMIRLGN